MHTIVLILLITSALSFGAVIGVRSRVDLVALGLLAFVLTVLLPAL